MRTSNLVKVMGVFLVVFIVILGLPVLASGEDSPPQIPMVLSGIAYINGNAANDGTVIVAKINGIEIKSCTTYTSGTQKGNFALTFTYHGNSNVE